MSTLPTDECDSGLWATATTMEHLPPVDLRIIQREPEWTQTDLFQSEGSSHPEGQGDAANANNQGILLRIRGASSQSFEESSGGRDHHEGSRANGGAQDSKEPQTYKKLCQPQEQARSCIRS